MANPVVAHGTLREKKHWHQGHPTWDIFHVYPDKVIIESAPGVQWASSLHAYLTAPIGKKARIATFVPGIPNGEATLTWGSEWWAAPASWTPVVASVVSLDDVMEIDFTWELTPGKASG